MKSDIYCERCKEQLDVGESYVSIHSPDENESIEAYDPMMAESRFCIPCGLVELAEAAAEMLKGGTDDN